MTMSSFRAAPRRGHLDRLRRIYGYISHMKNLRLAFRTDMPDLSGAPRRKFDWSESVYGKTEEPIPKDAPKALGKPVVTVSYVDAN